MSKGYGLVSLKEGEDLFVRYTDVRRRALGLLKRAGGHDMS